MEHTISLLDQVNRAFSTAVELACGSDYTHMFNRDCGVKVAKNCKKYGDLQSTCSQRIYNFHLAEKHRNGDTSEGMQVTTVSEYGFVQKKYYDSARALGLEIIECLPEYIMANIVADVVMDPRDLSNTIRITTAPHFQWHLKLDRHPCTLCGRFCQGSLGLRTHQVLEHGVDTELVREIFNANLFQMVVYSPPCATFSSAAAAASSVIEADRLCEIKELHKFDDTAVTEQLEYEGARSRVMEVEERPASSIMLETAKRGDLHTLRLLVEGNLPFAPGADQSDQSTLDCLLDPKMCRDHDGNTLLTWAAGNGHLTVCQYLVETCGMCPSECTGRRKRFRQPLHWAARNGHVHICEWLVANHHVDVDCPTENGTTPLHFAIWMGHLPCVQWLVEVGKCDVNRRNAFGCNAAHWGAYNGDVAMLRYLQSKDLDLYHINHNLRSPLHKAAVRGNAAACRWLLAPLDEGGGGLGLRHMQPELQGDTPMTLAASAYGSSNAGFGNKELERFLVDKYASLQDAAQDP